MEAADYLTRLQGMPRASWYVWRKRRKVRQSGYIVAHKIDGRVSVVPDYVLSDSLAIRRLAFASHDELCGWVIRDSDEIMEEQHADQ